MAEKQGSRTDVHDFKKKLDEGLSDLQLMEYDFAKYTRFIKTVDRYRILQKPTRTTDLKVYLYFGEPGSGKTRMAYEKYPQLYAFPIGKDLWSDGYSGESTILLDDFSGALRLVDALRLLDRYPLQVPRKGGFNWFCPENIIITTNIHPRDWYVWKDREVQQFALRRRFYEVWSFDCIIDGDPLIIKPEDFWKL
jgi:hypothetical protein